MRGTLRPAQVVAGLCDPCQVARKESGDELAARRQVLGRYGEDLAARWYEQHGYEIVARNWSCSAGELDIVARRDDVYVFCEVKARSSAAFGVPAEAVGYAKQARLRRLAAMWLNEARRSANFEASRACRGGMAQAGVARVGQVGRTEAGVARVGAGHMGEEASCGWGSASSPAGPGLRAAGSVPAGPGRSAPGPGSVPAGSASSAAGAGVPSVGSGQRGAAGSRWVGAYRVRFDVAGVLRGRLTVIEGAF